MKKVALLFTVLVILTSMVILLTGCGESKNETSNNTNSVEAERIAEIERLTGTDPNKTLIVSKQFKDENNDYVEKNTIIFEDTKALSIETVMTFAEESNAKDNFSQLRSIQSQFPDMDITISGNEITIKNNMTSYSKFYINFEGKTSRRDLIEQYLNIGYKVEQ